MTLRLRSIATLTLLALTALFAASCNAPEARVEVALITDAIPGVEFHFVELDLFVNGGLTPELERSARMQVATGDRFETARTITRFLPISPGSYHLEARLVARDGVRPVLDRNMDIEVREDMRIVIRMDRACITVECPGSGDSGNTECVGGECEDPTCASSPLTCPTHTGCTSAADCPTSSTCATSQCVDGVCFAFPDADACPATSYCDLTRGCVPYEGGDVCGTPCTLGECGVGRWLCGAGGTMTCEPFLTRPPGEPCGEGVCDGTGACEACVPGEACETGNACEVGITDCSTGHQVCVGTGPRPSGTSCREATGVCDAAEVCDGSSVACPSDARVAAGTECRASAGDCDAAEVCDGTEAACPADALRASDYVCRGSTGACDAEELCDGSTALCPSDARMSAGTVCRAASGACDGAEVCDGTAAACPSDSLRSAGFVCRAAASSCDVQEVCSGASSACPINAYVALGNACSAGFCNGMGMCLDTCTPGAACSTGNPCEVGRTDCSTGTPSCVAVGPGNAGAVCRASTGPCDVADTCSGTSTACTDVRAAATVVCRAAAAGGCDRAEMCNGTAVTCPADTFLPATTTCRAAATGGCDVAEMCTGTTAACPVDRFSAATVVCRVSGGFCDVAETCSGSAAACPANAFQPSTLQCRASLGACDPAEQCTGSAALCPTDALTGAGTTCRASSGQCDAREVCSGSVATCPVDASQPAGTACTTPYPDGVCRATTCVPRVLDVRTNVSDFDNEPFTCLLQSDGLVACWGSNLSGQIATGTAGGSIALPRRITLPASATHISVGNSHACALLTTGALWCWGRNANGQVIPGGSGNVLSPMMTLPNTADAIVEAGAGYGFTCVRRMSGAVDCWGQFGGTMRTTPTRMWASGVVDLHQSTWGPVVRLSDNRTQWIGDLGWGYTTSVAATLNADAAESVPLNALHVGTGWDHSCAVRSDRRVVCMGHDDGKAGDGLPNPSMNRPPVVALNVMNAAMVASGSNDSYAVTLTGELWNWNTSVLPALVPGVSGVTSVSSGFNYACFVRSGRAQCVGSNAQGQLGTGDTSPRSVLTDVAGLPVL